MKTYLNQTKATCLTLVKAISPGLLVLALILLSCGRAKAGHNTCGSVATTYIMHDTTWAGTPPSYFTGGNIFITDGHTLTLDSGIELWFHVNAKILNSDSPVTAAHLIINNAYLYSCGGSTSTAPWGGIHINGVPDTHGHYSEYDSLTFGINGLQSSVELTSAVIQDADTGVAIINHAILQINFCSFINCFVGASIIDSIPDHNYPKLIAHIGTTSTAVSSESYIRGSGFSIHNYVPQVGGDSLNKYKCVYLFGTQYLEIYGNYFQCDAPASHGHQRPTGIEALDASFSCHSSNGAEDPASGCIVYSGTPQPNSFTGLTYGIHAQGDTADNYTLHLDKNYFNQCFTAVYVLRGWHHVMHANYMRFTDSAAFWRDSDSMSYNNLVWLEFVDNFDFLYNKLVENKEHTAFLYVDNSGTDTKNITKDTFLNTHVGSLTNNSEYGIFFSGDNRNEYVTCNYLDHQQYGIYCDSTSLLTDFGTTSAGAGNVFTNQPSVPHGYPVFNANTTYTLWYSTHNCVNTNSPYCDCFCATFVTDVCDTPENCKKWNLGISPAFFTPSEIQVYPNPADRSITFDFTGSDIDLHVSKIEIFNILGQRVSSYAPGDADGLLKVTTDQYAIGMYVYRITQGGYLEKSGKFEVRH